MLKITTEARQVALVFAEVERRLNEEREYIHSTAFRAGFSEAKAWFEKELARELLPVIIRSTFGSDMPHAVNAAFKMADDYTAEVERRHAAAAASTQTMPPLRHPDGSLARGWTEGFPEITGRDNA